jgi:hypothetical protein
MNEKRQGKEGVLKLEIRKNYKAWFLFEIKNDDSEAKSE